MNYDPFNFSSNPLFQRGPTSYSYTPNLYGGTGQMKLGYGTSGLPPSEFAAAQKQEFQRLGEIQGLQTGALQQQQTGLQLRQSQMELADLEEQRRIRSILDKGMPDPMSYQRGAYESALRSPYGQQYQLQKEKTQYELNMARQMNQGGFGGFSSWSVPSFPS